MSTISASLRMLVIQRSGNRCEYCGISQIGQVATFHIDHVIQSLQVAKQLPIIWRLLVYPVLSERVQAKKFKIKKLVKL
jgi:hypothetical protein